jgi:hypothetical protein
VRVCAQAWLHDVITANSCLISSIVVLKLAPVFKRVYVKALLFIVSSPVVMEKEACPETLRLDLARLVDLQGEFQALCGRCACFFCLLSPLWVGGGAALTLTC